MPTLLPYEFEVTCISCGYNVIKRKHELSKTQRKRITFIKRLKYAKHNFFCICIDVYKTYESEYSDEIFENSSTLKHKKLEINNILIEKHKGMNENLDFEQNYISTTAIGIYKIGHDSVGIVKWLV